MISKRQDYSYLLDDLRDVSRQYSFNFEYDVIDKNGEIQHDERIITKFKFYVIYCMAYKTMSDMRESNSKERIDKETINRALASYGMFNYLINTCISEYRMYEDIGTGMVSYLPYDALAYFFYENDYRKELLMDYLNDELDNVFNKESSNERVK